MSDAYPSGAATIRACVIRASPEPAPDLIQGLNPGYVTRPGLPATPTSFGVFGALGAIVCCALR